MDMFQVLFGSGKGFSVDEKEQVSDFVRKFQQAIAADTNLWSAVLQQSQTAQDRVNTAIALFSLLVISGQRAAFNRALAAFKGKHDRAMGSYFSKN